MTISAPVFTKSNLYHYGTEYGTSSKLHEHEDTNILNSKALYSTDFRNYYDIYGNKVLTVSGEARGILSDALPVNGGILGCEYKSQNLVIIDAEGGITPILVP